MNSWKIPAKTFLLGEYAALSGHPALLLTTSPYFEVTLLDRPDLVGIHPDSPAGRLWQAQSVTRHGLSWFDPYDGIGGLGASTAQFFGAYQALNYLNGEAFSLKAMLEAYWQHAWSGEGVRPSGYDLVAQSLQGVVYCEGIEAKTYAWPFEDIGFLLLHTGNKVATHEHLKQVTMPTNLSTLADLVSQAEQAFKTANSELLIQSIQAYYKALCEMDLVIESSRQQIELLQKRHDILAIKGCGALGSDILLAIITKEQEAKIIEELQGSSLSVVQGALTEQLS